MTGPGERWNFLSFLERLRQVFRRPPFLVPVGDAAKVVPLENLCLSPQCGFASTHHGNLLSFEEQWRKLERVVQVAREVWR